MASSSCGIVSHHYTDSITVIARPGEAPCVFIFATAEFKPHFGWGVDFMRICWRVVAVAFICFPIASVALLAEEVERHEPEIDMFASMAGKCSTLKVAERDFACTSVAFSHSPGGRSSFIVPLNDPDDDTLRVKKVRGSKIICTSYQSIGCF